VQALDVDLGADGTLLASTGTAYQGKVFRSTDQGRTWADVVTTAPPSPKP